jgi:glycosyltransferase involved in cell wall biosynthesis
MLHIPSAEIKIRSVAHVWKAQRLLLSRCASPFSAGGVEARLLRRANWGIYDFDDALWAERRPGIHRIFAKPKVWERSVQAADSVIAGNDLLAEHALDHNHNVVMIPSCVEPSDYETKSAYDLPESPTLVWLGSPTTETYLEDITEPLLRLHHERGVRLRLISSGDLPLGRLSSMTDRVEWKYDNYAESVASADIGIAPMRETAFAVGKCAYKILQYGATAMPVIGSPVGANTAVIQQLDGLGPNTPREWVDAVKQLLDEPLARRELRGRRAKVAVDQNYSYGAWADVWLKAVDLNRDAVD